MPGDCVEADVALEFGRGAPPGVALPWVYEAGCPYFDWLFGDSEAGRGVIAEWLERPTSEVSVTSMVSASLGGEHVGGFIAMGAADLAARRRADGTALVRARLALDKRQLVERVRASQALFPSPSEDEWYLSKMGLLPEFRGRALGAALVQRYLEAGSEHGFARFRLDVSADNAPALAAYHAAGFEVAAEGVAGGLRYLAMTRGYG